MFECQTPRRLFEPRRQDRQRFLRCGVMPIRNARQSRPGPSGCQDSRRQWRMFTEAPSSCVQPTATSSRTSLMRRIGYSDKFRPQSRAPDQRVCKRNSTGACSSPRLRRSRGSQAVVLAVQRQVRSRLRGRQAGRLLSPQLIPIRPLTRAGPMIAMNMMMMQVVAMSAAATAVVARLVKPSRARIAKVRGGGVRGAGGGGMLCLGEGGSGRGRRDCWTSDRSASKIHFSQKERRQ